MGRDTLDGDKGYAAILGRGIRHGIQPAEFRHGIQRAGIRRIRAPFLSRGVPLRRAVHPAVRPSGGRRHRRGGTAPGKVQRRPEGAAGAVFSGVLHRNQSGRYGTRADGLERVPHRARFVCSRICKVERDPGEIFSGPGCPFGMDGAGILGAESGQAAPRRGCRLPAFCACVPLIAAASASGLFPCRPHRRTLGICPRRNRREHLPQRHSRRGPGFHTILPSRR